MMVGGSRIRQIGWALVLGLCFALMLALTFKVNAVKSEVRLIERQIIAAEQSKLMLETEFQTRASQQQLADWNTVEFGYEAPRANQYLESERQLAALGTPRGINAPSPIRVALNRATPETEQNLFAEWLDEDEPAVAMAASAPRAAENGSLSLAQRLTQPTAGVIAVAETSR